SSSGLRCGFAPGEAAKPQRSPLLLVGEADQEASGAFVISNPSSNDLNLTLAVQSQLPLDHVKLMPKSLILRPGEEAIVRIKVMLDRSQVENRDYIGIVFIPGSPNRLIDFVV